MVMLDLPEERLSLTPMVVGVVMEVVLSLERIPLRSIVLLLMLPDGWLRVWSPMDFVRELWYKSLMVLVLLDLCPFMFILMEQ